MMHLLAAPSLEMGSFSVFATPVVPFVWSILLFFVTARSPYNPTRVLQHGTELYVFRPLDGSSSQFSLEHVAISSKLDASEIQYTRLSSELPFLASDTQKPFTPVVDSAGNVTVYTGECGSEKGEIWTYGPGTPDERRTKTWWKQDVVVSREDEDDRSTGPRYLNGAIAFSPVVDGNMTDTSVYMFGGMCPTQGDGEDWQAHAEYSNLMMALDPLANDVQPLEYRLSLSTSRGPPIPEAGFTLTALAPSYSNRSDGSQTRQQNFVLVGGHTSSAFINMSQVALFSLPQQGWTFVPVQQPSTERTDLAIRGDITEVEPRSGHTAVLTPDGQHLVVYGGWIGDLNTPALPQLAVLSLGEEYGGVDQWEWSVPVTSGHGLEKDSGLYGHGAAMLPGGVMMITGGYTISPSSSRQRRGVSVNDRTLFFNVSSNTWITDYTPPKDPQAEPSKSGPLATTSQKAGLGVGLGIGVAAVLSLFIFYLWYTRRLRKQREIREKQLQELSLGAHRYTLDNLSPGPTETYYDDAHDHYSSPTNGKHGTRGWRQLNAQDAERTGLLVEIPSPTRGLRRSLGNRPTYLMNRYDERRLHGSGHIHVIDELEEEQEEERAAQRLRDQGQEQSGATENTPLHRSEMLERRESKGVSIFDNAPILDPFVASKRGSRMDMEQSAPLIHSAPASPEHEELHHRANEWLSVHDPGPVRRNSQHSAGRFSPDKSDRTESTLSERSMRSNLSSTGSMARTASMRSSAILNCANPFQTPDGSPPNSRSNRYSGGWESSDERSQSLTSTRSVFATAAEERDSFTTAPTSFMQLQAEGQSLLGGNPERARPGTSSTSNASSSHAYQDTGTPMSWAGTATTSLAASSQLDWPGQSRKRRWLGSVRKALARSSTTGPSSRTRSMTTSTPHLDRYRDDPQSAIEPHPQTRNSFPASSAPRRAASDATFWRRSRSSKQDWMDDQLDPMDPRSIWRRKSGDDFGAPEDAALAKKARQKQATLIDLLEDAGTLPTPRPIQAGDLGDARSAHTVATEDEDWDVEAAVERRVVQVTFTAPRGKLRVVNADIDRSSILSLPRDNEEASPKNAGGRSDTAAAAGANSPSSTATASPGGNRVKDLVGRFEGVATASRSSPLAGASTSSPPRPALKTGQEFLLSPYSVSRSPSPSPSPSISSLKVRAKQGRSSLAKTQSSETGGRMTETPAGRLCSEDITTLRGAS